MLKLETEFLEDRQARLVVTVDQERVQKELRAAARRISRQVTIPGFRKGKAPYHVIVRYYGEQTIYEEALDPLGQSVYVEALEQAELEPYAPGSLEDVQFDPLIMTFVVPLQPEIDLGDYREVRLPYEAPEVTDEDVDHVLEHMREDNAIMEPVERAIEMGDMASLDIKGEFVDLEDEAGNPKKYIDRKAMQVRITEEAEMPLPGFAQQVLGMEKDNQRQFELPVPDDESYDEELRGKSIRFDVSCVEVYSYELPELDDEFAQSVGDYDDLAGMKASVHEELVYSAARQARSIYVDQVLQKLFDEEVIQVSYPPVMIEEQIDDMVSDMEQDLGQQGLDMDIFLKVTGKTEEDVREEMRENAEEAIRRGLVFAKLIELEKLSVSDEEIEDEISTRSLSFGAQAGLARQLFTTPQAKNALINELLIDKAVERLSLIAQGEAPDLSELEVEEPAEESQPADAGPEAEVADDQQDEVEQSAEETVEEPELEEVTSDSEES